MGARRRGAPVDLVRDGVAPEHLVGQQGFKILFGALVSTAMWAQSKGYSEGDWVSLLDMPTSELGRQNKVRRGKAETPKVWRGRLSKAWDCAAANREESPDWTPDEARRSARATAQAIRDFLAVEGVLTESERIVLDYVAKVVDDRGSDRLTLPRAAALRATGLGLTAWRSAMKRLESKHFVCLVETGRPAGPGATKRRANVYKVMPPNPKTGLVVPAPIGSGAPGKASSFAAQVSGAPTVEDLVAFLRTPQGAGIARQVLAGEEATGTSPQSGHA